MILFLQCYDKRELQLVKLALLRKTNMIDFEIDVQKRLFPEKEPTDLLEKRQEVLSRLKDLQKETTQILEIILEEDVRKEIEKARDTRQLLEFLEKQHGVSKSQLTNALLI